MDVRPGAIELHIDELVLEGIEPSARDAIGDALQAQLVQLLGERPPSVTGAPDGGVGGDVAVSRVPTEPIAASMRSRPQELGTAIAASVHQGLLA